MARLVDDLLDTARITRGTIALEKQVTDPATVLTCAVEVAHPRFAAKRQSVALL